MALLLHPGIGLGIETGLRQQMYYILVSLRRAFAANVNTVNKKSWFMSIIYSGLPMSGSSGKIHLPVEYRGGQFSHESEKDCLWWRNKQPLPVFFSGRMPWTGGAEQITSWWVHRVEHNWWLSTWYKHILQEPRGKRKVKVAFLAIVYLPGGSGFSFYTNCETPTVIRKYLLFGLMFITRELHP